MGFKRMPIPRLPACYVQWLLITVLNAFFGLPARFVILITTLKRLIYVNYAASPYPAALHALMGLLAPAAVLAGHSPVPNASATPIPATFSTAKHASTQLHAPPVYPTYSTCTHSILSATSALLLIITVSSAATSKSAHCAPPPGESRTTSMEVPSVSCVPLSYSIVFNVWYPRPVHSVIPITLLPMPVIVSYVMSLFLAV